MTCSGGRAGSPLSSPTPPNIVPSAVVPSVTLVPVAGPQGPQGPPGGGEGGAVVGWFTGHGPPVIVVGAQAGDMYVDLDTGALYQLH